MHALHLTQLYRQASLLPAKNQLIARQTISSDPFVVKFAQILAQLPSQSVGLAANRRLHVIGVITNFHLFKSGNLRGIYDSLPEQERMNSSFEQYSHELNKIKAIFDSLPAQEQRELHLAIVLHDIGYLKEPGWKHGFAGGEMAPEIIRNGAVAIDADNVARIIQHHGLSMSFGVDIFPSDLQQLPTLLRQQLLILDCLDATAKGASLSNMLTVNTIKELLTVFEGFDFSDQDSFFVFRLKHLLSPINFVSLSDAEMDLFQGGLASQLSPQEYSLLKSVLIKQLENQAFPILQELFKDYGARIAAVFLRELSLAVSEKVELGQRVVFTSQPDIFSMPWGGPERREALAELSRKLQSGQFDRQAEFRFSPANAQDKKATIAIKLD